MSLHRINIELMIEGDGKDAVYVVDALLDAGFFQDAINDHDADAGPLHVVSALVRSIEDRTDAQPAASMAAVFESSAAGPIRSEVPAETMPHPLGIDE